jgi:uncharacterized protein YxeA
MKKIMTLMLGLSLVIGATSFAFGKDDTTTTAKKKGKKAKKTTDTTTTK